LSFFPKRCIVFGQQNRFVDDKIAFMFVAMDVVNLEFKSTCLPNHKSA